MFGGFFDMDKPFWRWMGKIPDLILLSLCWYICCLPVITIIPASCALFDAVSRNLMMDDKGIYKRYFRSFVRELKMGIPLSILWAAIGFIAWYGDNVIAYNAQNNEVFAIYSIVYRIMILMMFVGVAVSMFIPSNMSSWLYTAIKILTLPLVMGIGYELLKLAGRHENWFTRAISAPGKWMQRITTNEPTDDMIECAITAFVAVIPEDKEQDNW